MILLKAYISMCRLGVRLQRPFHWLIRLFPLEYRRPNMTSVLKAILNHDTKMYLNTSNLLSIPNDMRKINGQG